MRCVSGWGRLDGVSLALTFEPWRFFVGVRYGFIASVRFGRPGVVPPMTSNKGNHNIRTRQTPSAPIYDSHAPRPAGMVGKLARAA